MKKIVLTYGLIAGAILSAMMFITMPMHDRIGYDNGLLIGYTTMVVAFLMVFFGIRSYRENVAGGALSFGRGLRVGVMIALIGAVCYVLSWELIYYKIWPGIAEDMFTEMVKKEQASGRSDAVIAAAVEKVEKFRDMYRNPLINSAVTFMEVLPVGLLATLVSAAILRRRRSDVQASGAQPAGAG